MTDKEKLKAIEDAIGSPLDPEYCFDEIFRILEAKPDPTKMPEWMERQFDNAEKTVASWPESKRIAAGIAQPDPHPLASMRFDEATPEQFREFWEAAGFAIGAHDKKMWADKPLNGVTDELTVFQGGMITLWSGDSDIHIASPLTFQEALDALNELAATKIMGGWA